MFRWLWQREGENYGPPSVEGNNFMAAFVGKALVFFRTSASRSENVNSMEEYRTSMYSSDDRTKPGRGLLGSTDITRRTVVLYGAVFVALACVVEIINRRFLYPSSDGLFWEVLQAYHAHYGSWASLEVSNPLQGMFDIFPQDYRGTLLLDTLSALPFDVRVNGALIHAAYAAFGVISTYVMACGAGATRRAALFAAMLAPVLILPGLLSSEGVVGQMLATNPNQSYVIFGIVLVIGLYWMIDGQLNVRFFLGTLLAFLVTAEACNSFSLQMTLLLPAVIVFGAGGLIASESIRELKVKLGWAIAMVAGLAALGMPAYLYGLGSNTAFHFFFEELNYFSLRAIPTNAILKDDLLYVLQWRPSTGGAMPAIVSILGIAAAMWFAVFGEPRRLRFFARSFVVLLLSTGLIIFFCHFWFYFTGYDFKGPLPFYFVYVLWPFHIIFVALAAETALGLVASAAATWGARKQMTSFAGHGVLATALALPLCGVVVLKNASYFDLTTKPNVITDYLSAHNAVILGAPYRGVAATFIGTHDRDAVSQIELNDVWVAMQLFNHNDFASYGLWTYHIPTLIQFSGVMTPQWYLMLSELLARPSDIHAHSTAIITIPNEAILKLWGARFVIADYALPFGVERVSMPVEVVPEWFRKKYEYYREVNFHSPVRLFELVEANLGNYSPRRVIEVGTATEVVDHMRVPGFDGARTVIVTEKLSGDFVPAREATMIVERGGLSLRAASAGESLLVLPVQYSHCWQLRNAPNATLFRANLMQLGIRFSGELKAELRQVFGPLWHSYCRVEDAHDMERLKIDEARSR